MWPAMSGGVWHGFWRDETFFSSLTSFSVNITMKLPIFSKLLLGGILVLASSAAHAKPKSWVRLTTATNATKYVTGAPINIILTAKNVHSRDAFLHFTSGQRFDMQLFPKGSNDPVYTWSADKMFAMMTGQLRLAPNQSQTFQAQIGAQQGEFKPGKYELRVHMTNSSHIEATPVELEVVAAPAEPIKFEAKLDKTEMAQGESVKVSMTVTNTTKEDQTLHFGSGQSFDVQVFNDAGESVWTWGANKRFIMALRDVPLAAGESKTFDATWNGLTFPDFKKGKGTYTIKGILTTNPRLESAPIKIELK
ncbi:hypothetical protein EON83_07735 [bacterium]|nr:MAG: hypothetical protein EON83_07735 [bacterium]